MSYFAEIQNGVVTRVVVADKDFIDSGALGDPKNWKETSMDGSVRKNYASVGHTYDTGLDAFVPPQPYPSWSVDAQTAKWKAPKQPPQLTAQDKGAYWDESKTDWIVVPKST